VINPPAERPLGTVDIRAFLGFEAGFEAGFERWAGGDIEEAIKAGAPVCGVRCSPCSPSALGAIAG
jgi:hypothetical protein